MLAAPAHAVDSNVKPRQFKARQPLLGDVPLYKVIDADSGARIFWKRLGGRQSSNNKVGNKSHESGTVWQSLERETREQDLHDAMIERVT
jgi:hypothetical protein